MVSLLVSLLPGFPCPNLCFSTWLAWSFYNVPVLVFLLPEVFHWFHVTHKPEFKLLNTIQKDRHDLIPGASVDPCSPHYSHMLYTLTLPNYLRFAKHTMLSYVPILLNMLIPLHGTFYHYSILWTSFGLYIHILLCYNLFPWVCLSFQTVSCLSAKTELFISVTQS